MIVCDGGRKVTWEANLKQIFFVLKAACPNRTALLFSLESFGEFRVESYIKAV